MTTTAVANPHYAPERACAQILGGAIWTIGAGFWAVLLAASALVPAIINHFAQVEGSFFSNTSQAPRWFLFVMALVLAVGGIGPHVAAGLTRRLFTRTLTVCVLGGAVAFAQLTTATFALERLVYGRLGWPLDLQAGHVFTSSDQWGLILLETVLLVGVFGVAGMATGAAYFRFGGWVGTLLLPVTVGPAMIASFLFGADWTGEVLEAVDWPPPPVLIAAAATVALHALLITLTFLFLRHAPVRRFAAAQDR